VTLNGRQALWAGNKSCYSSLGFIDGAAYYDFLGTRDVYLSMGTKVQLVGQKGWGGGAGLPTPCCPRSMRST